VFIADSSGFPMLPAKNMSFTMMANAMRIADYVIRELKEN
jgi:choline dehydrogenase-like flavoprotein